MPCLLGTVGPGRQRDAVDLGPQNGGGLRIGRMCRVGRIKVDDAGEALGGAPEEGTGGGDCVVREGVHQLRDAIVELALQAKKNRSSEH